jgi:hypothetical protein
VISVARAGEAAVMSRAADRWAVAMDGFIEGIQVFW